MDKDAAEVADAMDTLDDSLFCDGIEPPPSSSDADDGLSDPALLLPAVVFELLLLLLLPLALALGGGGGRCPI